MGQYSVRMIKLFTNDAWMEQYSARMIKLFGKSTALPLRLIFQSILKDESFPQDWRKSNIVPYHKEESKNLISLVLCLLIQVCHNYL